jgi:hypothetical protein
MVLVAAALALAMGQTEDSAPQGPPATTPMTAQSNPTPPSHAPEAKASIPPEAEPIPEPPAVGQSAAGVTSYPASYFDQFQPNTVNDMIAHLPGFIFDDGDTVRGFAGAAGNVLIDGARPTSKSDDLFNVLRRIPISQVERIDIIRGGAPGIDMQGKTVMANVIRKGGSSTTAMIAMADSWVVRDGRQEPALRMEATHRDNGATLEGSLLIARFDDDSAGDGPEIRQNASGVYEHLKDNTEAGGVQAIATAAYETPLYGGKFKVNGQLFGQNYIYNELDDNRVGAADDSLEHDHQNKEQGELGLTYTHSFGAHTSVETLYIQQLQGEDYLSLYNDATDAERFRERHTNGESILRSTVTYTASNSLTLEVGAEGAYNWLHSHTTYVDNDALVDLPAASVQVTELRGEGFAKATWVASAQWTLEAGVRLEGSQIGSSGDVVLSKSLFYPKPRVVVTWSPTRSDQIRVRIEQEVGQLDFTNFVASSALTTGEVHAGNPNLVPQQAFVSEIAYERRFWEAGDITLTYRHSALTDVVDWAPILDPSGDFDAPANIGKGREDELIAAFTAPLAPLLAPGGQLKANYTWRTSSVTDPTTGQERPISGLRNLEGEIDFTQDLPKWKLNWGLTYNTGFRQPYYRFSQVEVDSFRPFGTAFVEYKPVKDISIRAELDDIGADYRRNLIIYPDLRNENAPTYTSKRDLYFGPVPYFRVRHTF